jgi:hypothetical protein
VRNGCRRHESTHPPNQAEAILTGRFLPSAHVGDRVQPPGLGSFDAARHCAYASAARRLARRLQAQAAALDAAAAAALNAGARLPMPIPVPQAAVTATSVPGRRSVPMSRSSPRMEFVEVSPYTSLPSPPPSPCGSPDACAGGSEPLLPCEDDAEIGEFDVVPCFPVLSLSSTGSYGDGAPAAAAPVFLRSAHCVPVPPGGKGAAGQAQPAPQGPRGGLLA